MASLNRAAEEFFDAAAEDVPPLDLAGSTDSGIVRSLMEHFDSPYTEDGEREFYEIYLGYLSENLATRGDSGRVLPGVPALLDALSRDARFQLGLLTGNIARGAAAKLKAYGLAKYFSFGAYGDDHYDRNALGAFALDRAEAHMGTRFRGEECVVIGDTPKDVRCGQAFGARTIAVATGKFHRAALEECHPDAVLEDLSDKAAVEAQLAV